MICDVILHCGHMIGRYTAIRYYSYSYGSHLNLNRPNFYQPFSRFALVYQSFCFRTIADRLYSDWIDRRLKIWTGIMFHCNYNSSLKRWVRVCTNVSGYQIISWMHACMSIPIYYRIVRFTCMCIFIPKEQ